jgi:hypothetical protein
MLLVRSDKLVAMYRPSSFLVPVAVFVAAAVCLEASRTPPRPKAEALETPQTTTAEILRLENLLDDAESHHRVAAVDDLIADDYSGITVGGGIIMKQDVLKQVGGNEEASSESSDRKVRPMANAAVYTALVLDHGIDPKTGQAYALATRVTDIWQKRAGTWKLVNDQATVVNLASQ